MAPARIRVLVSRNGLTPARWVASNLRSQLVGALRAWDLSQAVQPWDKPRDNQHIGIAALFALSQLYQRNSSRHVCAGVCAGARAYTRGEKLVQLGQTSLSLSIHVVSCPFGCPKLVPARDKSAGLELAGGARIILAGGYAGRIELEQLAGAQGASSSVELAPPAQTFGDFAGLARADRQRSDQVRANGGNPPFLSSSSGRVGSVTLEAWAQGLGHARQSGAARKLRGLKRGTRPACDPRRSREAPPCPQSRGPQAPAWQHTMLTGFGTGFARLRAFGGSSVSASDAAQRRAAGSGRGEGYAWNRAGKRPAGQGEQRWAGIRLRRRAEARQGGAGVN